ncbi:SDR family NAD(P)-dependent oxidoreductase [Haladaptatus sp. ZSTT2]|uniref:SDR family NAD(P)-dependent oxidoreductase n=1 Tax=Haladaptatus sp. ZSTT2 TaxID=3120515 RepID=UPI00300F0F50
MVRTALVTGGSGGIGSACVRALAPECNVAFQYYSNEEAANALVADLEAAGHENVLALRANVTDEADVEELVAAVTAEFGSLDILVNSAGIMKGQSLEEISAASIDQLISINLVGTILCTRAALPAMVESETGHIINVSSTAGTHGSYGDPVYAASKGGQVSFTQSLASVYTKQNIFSNTVAPGAVETDMFPDEWVEGVKKGYPLKRLVQPEEVAEAVVFLSNTTSISGEVIEIDQGKLL